ncbi:MAG: glycoside hydrolase family 16 protein [Phycisphaerales bacterium]
MKLPAMNVVGALIPAAGLALGACSVPPRAGPADLPGWKLTLADEFEGPAGAAPDGAVWGYDLGGHGWGNNELQCYTRSTDNCALDGRGNLVIRALKGQTADDRGNTREYSSARVLTKGRFAQLYGRFEARVKLPRGKGIWPAFWMLGENIGSAGWPRCGEIDIMEFLGHDSSTAYTTVHGPGYSGSEGKGAPFRIAPGRSFTEGFHVFAVEWSPEKVEWFIDGESCHTVTPADLSGKEWVFNTPFFLILNLAVGGNWPGNPDEHTQFPQEYVIDYVRAYAKQGG